MYKFYQYTQNLCRIVISKSDYIPEHKEKSDYIAPSDNYLSELSSISRSKRMIREIALCNDFQYFFTATVNSELCDRFSLSDCQTRIRKIMKSIKRKHEDFIYLFITEMHKDGAYHFHGLCSNLDLYTNKYGYLSSSYFDKLGFNSFSIIKDKQKVSNYITKYITKQCVKNEAGSVYFCSRGLKRATSYEIAPIDLDKKIFPYWSNEYIKIFDYDVRNLTREQNQFLRYNIIDKKTFLDKIL